MREIHVEPVKKKNIYFADGLLSRQEVEGAIDHVVGQVCCNMKYFETKFPFSAVKDQTYGIIENIEQIDGSWTGLLWLYYEYTGDREFRRLAEQDVSSFPNRVEKCTELDYHDLGFLYSLSYVAGYKLTGPEEGKRTGLLAADKFLEHFQEKDGFIQAWGGLGVRDNYCLIIDCLLDISLLYWVSQVTGDDTCKDAAVRHYGTACRYVIREDASAYHIFYPDPETGGPVRGVTRQGYSDESARARGQAWGIYGIPPNYRYTRDSNALPLFKGMTSCFLGRPPQDDVCYWNLIFANGDCQSRDSSAAAVAVCGIHETLKYPPEVHSGREAYQHAMHSILKALMTGYTNPDIREGASVLLHGVCSWHLGEGMDEGNIWGDYYYVKALMHFCKDWSLYW